MPRETLLLWRVAFAICAVCAVLPGTAASAARDPTTANNSTDDTAGDYIFMRAAVTENEETVYHSLFRGPATVRLANVSAPLPSMAVIQGAGAAYPGDASGCSSNRSVIYPAQTILVLERGGCSLERKLTNVAYAGASGAVIYNNATTGADDGSQSLADDATTRTLYPSRGNGTVPLLVLFGSADVGRWLVEALLYVDKNDVARGLQLFVASDGDAPAPSLWEFMLTTVILLLAFSFIMSVAMHCHLHRIRQRQLAASADAMAMEPPVLAVAHKVVSAEELAAHFPVYAYGDSCVPRTDSASQMCVVCLEEFSRGDLVRRLACHHVFHRPCIDRWLTTKNAVCPLCKVDVECRDDDELDKSAHGATSARPRFLPRLDSTYRRWRSGIGRWWRSSSSSLA